MSALDPADMRRLKATLTRLASPHDGEVVAAARAAGRILGKAGLGFSDIGLLTPSAVPRQRKAAAAPVSDPLRERIKRLILCRCAWTAFEQDFLINLCSRRLDRPLTLSERQTAVLAGLETKATLHAEACAA